MTDLEKVEKLIKALQEGKTLVNDDGTTVKIVNGFICKFFKHTNPIVGAEVHFSTSWQIQGEGEELLFEITPNQLAEYECRDGRTLITNGVRKYNTYCGILNDGTSITTLRKYGNTDGSVVVIRKIRDL